MNVRVDPELCTGCGLCVDTCPDVFQLNDSDVAEVIVDPIPPQCEQECKEAAGDCPTAAIIVDG